MNLHPQHKYQDEIEDDLGSSGGGAALGGDEASPPNFFVGEMTENDVVGRLGQVDELGELLSAAEGRFGEQFGSLAERVAAAEQALGVRTAVEIPDGLVSEIDAFFTKYDPKLEGAGELFKRLLSESIRQQPLDAASIGPHVQPLLEAQRYEIDTGWLEDVENRLSFDREELSSLDPANPSSDVQKAFLSFWKTAPQSVRAALTAQREDGSVANPRAFGKALLLFDAKWKKVLQEKSESAGASANRLAGARQTSSSGRASTGGSQLRSEEDGFASVFAKAS